MCPATLAAFMYPTTTQMDMILSDRDILKRLESGDLVVEPLDDPDLQIQPASIDLRLGREFLEFQRTNIPCIHPTSQREVSEYVDESHVDDGGEFILHPGDFVLGTTKERVEIPPDLIAHVEGRSSLGRLAIVVHASLPYDEPVFLWTPTEGFGLYEIGEIVESETPARAVAFDPTTLAVSTHRVTDYITNPRQRIYRVRLSSGKTVHVTKDHNLFTIDAAGGVTRIPSEAADGSLVMVPEQIPNSPTEQHILDLEAFGNPLDLPASVATDGGVVSAQHGNDASCTSNEATKDVLDGETVPVEFSVTPAFGWVIGLYLSAGTCDSDRLVFQDISDSSRERLTEWFEAFNTPAATSNSTVTVASPSWAHLFNMLLSVGKQKHLPKMVWNWPETVLEQILVGIHAGNQVPSIDECTVPSQILASQLQYLNLRLGKPSVRSTAAHRDDVTVSGPTDASTDLVPVPYRLLTSARQSAGLTPRQAVDQLSSITHSELLAIERGDRSSMSKQRLSNMHKLYRSHGADTRRLSHLCSGDVRFEKVMSVAKTGRVEKTYDLEVQPNGQLIENFIGGQGGIFLSNTAGLCDPGYKGQITLELSNLGTAPVALSPGMRVSQLTFTELTSPAERPYGAERGSKYQGQTGPQASRIQGDREFGGEQ